MRKKVLIIGAGPAGLTCGYQVSKDKDFNQQSLKYQKMSVAWRDQQAF